MFWLSPNDLVYVPSVDEVVNGRIADCLDKNRIYKIVSFTGKRLYGIPYSVANVIVDKFEFSLLNKIEFIGEKEICIPVKISRLGRVLSVGKRL